MEAGSKTISVTSLQDMFLLQHNQAGIFDNQGNSIVTHCMIGCLFVTRGPGDSKLLCGPTTRIEGKERCDSKGREKARKAQS